MKETEGALRPTTKSDTITTEQVTAWREELFDGFSLRLPLERLNDWKLNHFLWAAVVQVRFLFDLPESAKESWHSPAWDFGRFAKAHPALTNLDADQALSMVSRTIGNRFWEQHFCMNLADAEMAFDNVWTTCRNVPGHDPLTMAVLRAKQIAEIEDDRPPAGYKTFLNVARFLKLQLKDVPFMLPCHKLAPLLECLPITISRYRRKAVRDGYLAVVKEHKYRSAGKGEATEFVFVGEHVVGSNYIES